MDYWHYDAITTFIFFFFSSLLFIYDERCFLLLQDLRLLSFLFAGEVFCLSCHFQLFFFPIFSYMHSRGEWAVTPPHCRHRQRGEREAQPSFHVYFPDEIIYFHIYMSFLHIWGSDEVGFLSPPPEHSIIWESIYIAFSVFCFLHHRSPFHIRFPFSAILPMHFLFSSRRVFGRVWYFFFYMSYIFLHCFLLLHWLIGRRNAETGGMLHCFLRWHGAFFLCFSIVFTAI